MYSSLIQLILIITLSKCFYEINLKVLLQSKNTINQICY